MRQGARLNTSSSRKTEPWYVRDLKLPLHVEVKTYYLCILSEIINAPRWILIKVHFD